MDNRTGKPISFELIDICKAVTGHRFVIPAKPTVMTFTAAGEHVHDDYMCTCYHCGWQECVRVRPGAKP